MRPSASALCQTVAVSVATILGTGILGLPVSLHQSGLQPFYLLFTVSFVSQAALVIIVAEMLQRAYVIPDAYGEEAALSKQEASPLEAEHAEELDTAEHTYPSLYMLAALFIPSEILRTTFNAVILMHFILVTVTYSLAGPQAYYALVPALKDIPLSLSTAVFILVIAFLVFFYTEQVLPPLSLGTLLKGIILTILVGVTFISGLSIRHSSESHWDPKGIIDPFLIGVFALSGVSHLMPVTFQTCVESLPTDQGPRHRLIDREFMSAYRAASVLALLICYVLNVGWCIAVLFVVPQNASSLGNGTAGTAVVPNATLTSANNQGLISTIPLIEVLQATHNKLNWITAFLVNLFIAISITISVFIMLVGLLHFLEGAVAPSQPQTLPETMDEETINGDLDPMSREVFPRFSVAVLSILLIAVLNPSAIFKIMEGGLSLALNLESGFFIPYMFYVSRSISSAGFPNISAALSPVYACLLAILGVPFVLVAIFVDVIFYLPTHSF